MAVTAAAVSSVKLVFLDEHIKGHCLTRSQASKQKPMAHVQWPVEGLEVLRFVCVCGTQALC
jgi:hypothetical protein